MFRSKPSGKSQAAQEIAVQALTLDYVIEGNLRVTGELGSLLQGAQGFHEIRYAFEMVSAQVQSTGHLATPAFSAPLWVMYHAAIVALIPQDDAGAQIFSKAAPNKSLSFKAVMYAGPYVIRACLAPGGALGISRTTGGIFEGYGFILAKDAEISCQSPETQLARIAAPWVALNTMLMQGYYPE